VESVQRLAGVRVAGVASAVAGVDLPVGVEEEDHEGQVVVELEEAEVGVVDSGQPDTDELVGDVFDAVETDNLPVKLTTVRSGDAPHDHHDRLAGSSRLGLARVE
jgi:hypothetical protein